MFYFLSFWQNKIIVKFKFLCVMKNTILKQINVVGAVLGYPFYIYPDGTCGKNFIFQNEQAAAVVKCKFPMGELKSKFATSSPEDEKNVLKYLSHIGKNIGFPFYILPDGTCSKSSFDKDNFDIKTASSSAMIVQRPFNVAQILVNPNLCGSLFNSSSDDDDDCVATVSVDGNLISYAASTPFKPTMYDLLHLEKIRKELLRNPSSYILRNSDDERVMICFGLVRDLKNYFSHHLTSEKGPIYLIMRNDWGAFKAYFKSFSFFQEHERLMINYCSEYVVMLYMERHGLYARAQRLMVQQCSDNLITAFQKKYLLDYGAKILLQKREENFFSFLHL